MPRKEIFIVQGNVTTTHVIRNPIGFVVNNDNKKGANNHAGA